MFFDFIRPRRIVIEWDSQATTDGLMTLTVTFRLGTDPDKATQLVQNRVQQARTAMQAVGERLPLARRVLG